MVYYIFKSWRKWIYKAITFYMQGTRFASWLLNASSMLMGQDFYTMAASQLICHVYHTCIMP